VIKPGGKFLLVHSAYKHELFHERNTYWSKLFNICIHTPDELIKILYDSGFKLIKTIEKVECNWLTIIANKE